MLLAGGQAATSPETESDDRLKDHCKPSATAVPQSKIKEHQAIDSKQAADQVTEEKQQAQESVEVPMHQEEENGPTDVSDAAADPEGTLAAHESRISPSLISHL